MTDMETVCISPIEKARNAEGRVLQAFSCIGKATAIAASLGWSDTKVSRVENEHIPEALRVLYALGFKIVSSDKVCVSADELRMLRKSYARAVQIESIAEQLFNDDE